jgi:glycerophosphoryl diester phosphodiesterase
MMKPLVVLIPICLGIGSCVPEFPSEADLFVDFEIIDAPTTPLGDPGRAVMNGVYEVVEGRDVLGNPVVGKWVGRRWCLYSQHDVVFSESAGGSSGDSIKLSGYVRTVRSGSGIRVRFKILRNDGAEEVISGGIPSSLRIQGTMQDGRKIELRRVRNIHTSSIHILAHQGGGRNSDRLGISENSIPMIQHAAIFGATGIEIDVRRTRDNKVIVFHDNTFSPRTVQGTYLLGKVENYDLEQIKLFGRLINGETIPTLSEALNAVIEDTELSLVWLDVKDPAVVDQVVQIQKAAMNHAATNGRDVKIVMGIPSSEVLKAYTDNPSTNTTDVLVELDAETALSLPSCKVWAPYWTRNITAGDIARMHSAGKLVFTWTVDLRESIVDYLNRVDGILTDYPSLVTGIHDSKD